MFFPQPWPNLRVVYLALNGRLPPTVFNSRWLKREIQSKQGPLNPFDEFEYLNLTTHFQDWFKLYRYHMVKKIIELMQGSYNYMKIIIWCFQKMYVLWGSVKPPSRYIDHLWRDDGYNHQCLNSVNFQFLHFYVVYFQFL